MPFDARTLDFFSQQETPFYFYDLALLDRTLSLYTRLLDHYGYKAHYAIKANANGPILQMMKDYGLGVDCVSGNEVSRALEMGFDPRKVVYAGVGKTDKEILTALRGDIGWFNCESVEELRVINQLAGSVGRVARVSLRLNPNIDAHTHKYVSTGRSQDKFGISTWMFEEVLKVFAQSPHLSFAGIHFHVGSQITRMDVFAMLCQKANEYRRWFADRGVQVGCINLGGGLGIDYESPHLHPVAPFEEFFQVIHHNLEVLPGQEVHFEPGRSLVAQCGSLITRVLYIKKGRGKQFAILDAGMNDLIRPALYGARHKITNLSTRSLQVRKYDVVGPVCESSDRFGQGVVLPLTRRGDLLSLSSVGAYGQVMAMGYNLRDFAKAYYSTEI